ncbi:MAG: hypothetical protein WCC78_19680 [Terriglobales bacterium]|jgi:hypothetical protein
MKNPEFVVSVVLAIVTAFVIAVFVQGDPATKVRLAISYGGLIMLFLFGFLVLAGIASGKIDISQILAEKDGSGASMSRFQLMIFTFVISLSLFLIVVGKGDFPKEIPNQILELLGISATTYGVSKGIQATSNDTNAPPQDAAPPPPPAPPNPPQPQ